MMGQLLKIGVETIGYVKKAANRRRFLLMKADVAATVSRLKATWNNLLLALDAPDPAAQGAALEAHDATLDEYAAARVGAAGKIVDEADKAARAAKIGKGDAAMEHEMVSTEMPESVATALEKEAEGEREFVAHLKKGAQQQQGAALLRLLAKADSSVIATFQQALGASDPEPVIAAPVVVANSEVALAKATLELGAAVEIRARSLMKAEGLSHGRAQVKAIHEFRGAERDAAVNAVRATTARPVAKADPALPQSEVLTQIKALAKTLNISDVEVMKRHPALYDAYTRETHGRGAIFNRR